MDSPQTRSSPFVLSSSPDYITSANVASEPQTFPNQPAPAPPQPQHYDNIPPEVTHQRDGMIAQLHNSNQPLSSQPLISTCDKSSIEDILDRLRSLNSSIADAVDAIMERGLKGRRINLRKGVKKQDLSPLMRMAVSQRNCTKGNVVKAQNMFKHAILYDIIVGFIYDIIEGEKKRAISFEYENFRANIEKVRNTEPLADAQNWIRIAGRIVELPPDATWLKLARTLMDEINSQFWQIGGQGARSPNVVKQKTGKQYFPEIIKNAFAISMDMYAGIFSEQLKLVIGKEGLGADSREVEMSEDLARATSVQQNSECRDCFIWGRRSLGLASELDDGTRKLYLKPQVAYI